MSRAPRPGGSSDLNLPERPARQRRGRGGILLIVGVVGAALAGLALGIIARPELGVGAPPKPMTPVTSALSPDRQMQVLINPAAAPKAPGPSDGPLEVLPEDMIQAAPQAPEAPQAPVAGEPPMAPDAPLAPLPPQAARAREVASFDCAGARPGAEQLVCGNPRLAAADRRLVMAYRRALDAGVPAERLQRQQARWITAREAAAEHSPDAVAQVYEARIEELQDEAAEARGLSR